MAFDSLLSRRSLLKSSAVLTVGALAATSPLGRAFAQSAPAITEEEWNAVVAAAEAEGQVNIQGPLNDLYRESIQQFQVAFPNITLNYTPTSGDDFEARYTAERRANQYLSDFFIGGVSGAVYLEQIPSGWYSPLKPLIVRPDVLDDSAWLGGFQRGFLDAEGQHIYTVQADKQININVDRSQVPLEAFNSLEGLLDPQWRGRIAIIDPRLAQDQMVTLILYALGEDALRSFLRDQEPVLTRNRRQLQEWAVRGAYPITLGVSASELKQFQDQGVGLTVERLDLPPNQTPWTPGWGAVALLANVPHPNAAKVFINWFLSQEAQADWASRGAVNSRRTDVESGLPNNAVTEDAFVNGLTFNSAALATLPRQGVAIATEVLG